MVRDLEFGEARAERIGEGEEGGGDVGNVRFAEEERGDGEEKEKESGGDG